MINFSLLNQFLWQRQPNSTRKMLVYCQQYNQVSQFLGCWKNNVVFSSIMGKMCSKNVKLIVLELKTDNLITEYDFYYEADETLFTTTFSKKMS